MSDSASAPSSPSTPRALVIFSNENMEVLLAIAPHTSALAIHAKRWHELPTGGQASEEDVAAFDFVEAWFVDSVNAAEVCPAGVLSGSNAASITAIYKVGC